jgi:2-keto-4-pentenoate hydratase
MMNKNEIDRLATVLLDARTHGSPVTGSLFEVASNEDAYAIQDACARRGGWFSNARPRAWKVGTQGRTSTPTAAPLPDAGLLDSPARIGPTKMPRLGIEAELGFRVARDLDDTLALNASQTTIASCFDAICVTIEVVDSRLIEGAQSPGPNKLADLQLHGALVIGDLVPFALREWSDQRCVVKINGRVVAESVGTHPIGDPLWTMRWLVEHTARRYGGLRKGDLITSGAWTGIMPVAQGDMIEVLFDGIGQASIAFDGP